ncbi:MAG: hypothetical protein CVV44_12690 [Spirochaetae bacterium HGW-Spirochaetae-1]|jgi:outer membrane protein TolC|nr:MAG: hypothetical protein CVV44_12690 [Spirochaetae bacterium HGW-Spirochaetae-1]
MHSSIAFDAEEDMFRNRKIIIAAALLGACLFFSQSIFSQENGDNAAAEKEKTVAIEKKTDTGGLADKIQQDKKLKLTVDRVIEYLLRNNLDVKQALLEYKGTGSAMRNYQSKYDYTVFGNIGHSFEKNPNESTVIFNGESTRTTNITAGIFRNFNTGTKVSVSANSVIIDSPRDPISGFPPMGGKGYQNNLKVELEQDLMKNLFGATDRMTEQSISNAEKMQKQAVKMKLSGLLVEALIGYWNVAIAEENVKTGQENLKSTEEIRNLIARKLRLGLSENEDIMDWNSKVLQGKTNVDMARKYLFDARLAVLRTLNLDEGLEIELGQTFQKTGPEISVEQALKDAFVKRIDYNNQRVMIKNAELEYKMAYRNLYPSLKMKASVGSADYDPAYGESFNTINENYSVSLEATYPLGNTAAETRLRDARLNIQKSHVQLESLEKSMRDEIKSLVMQCDVDFKVYEQTKQAREYAENYYFQVLTKFRRGRYSAVQLKLALDSLFMARQQELKSLVDYNIALLRRDFARNVIFENFAIDIETILKRVEN